MRGKMMKQYLSIFKLGVFLVSCKTLLAYLDPGSGSLIVQILVAIIVGALATFRFWKARLLSLFGVKQDGEDDDASGDAEITDVDEV